MYRWTLPWALVILLTLSNGALGTSVENCESDMTSFELVTGYVYTAPKDHLDSITGTLMLTDCLEACSGNETCYSVNYETGLCVLFSSNADANPGRLLSFFHFQIWPTKEQGNQQPPWICISCFYLVPLLTGLFQKKLKLDTWRMTLESAWRYLCH